MHLLKAICIAFSMFTAIPMPQFAWDDDAFSHSLAALPAVGLLLAASLWGWIELCALVPLSSQMRALGLTALPLLITGGIHLDGFCDTWDALSSHQDAQRMREILKDPHIGAFGVMHLALLVLTTYVFWLELPELPLAALLVSPILSRSLAGVSVALFPLAHGEGLARSFAEGSNRRTVGGVCAGIGCACALVLAMSSCWLTLLAAALIFAYYRLWLVTRFKGLSGDLCGWFIQSCELWMLVCLVAQNVLEVLS